MAPTLTWKPVVGLTGDPRHVSEPATDPYAQPRPECCETDVADILEDLGIDYLYEPYFYPLAFRSPTSDEPSFGFSPDFWLPPTSRRAGLHVEVTMADRHVVGCKRCHLRPNPHIRLHGSNDTAASHFAKKRRKMAKLLEVYGLRTLLITHQVLQHELRHNPYLLRRMVNQVAARPSQLLLPRSA